MSREEDQVENNRATARNALMCDLLYFAFTELVNILALKSRTEMVGNGVRQPREDWMPCTQREPESLSVWTELDSKKLVREENSDF